jgi:hypothetical protein
MGVATGPDESCARGDSFAMGLGGIVLVIWIAQLLVSPI